MTSPPHSSPTVPPTTGAPTPTPTASAATSAPAPGPPIRLLARPRGFLAFDYSGGNARKRRVLISNPDGRRQEPLDVTPARPGFLVDVARNGRTALLGGSGGEDWGLFAVSMKNRRWTEVAAPDGPTWYWAALLPDGRSFVANELPTMDGPNGRLHLVGDGESSLLPLPEKPGWERTPADVSDDGRWLVYTESLDEISGLFLMDLRDPRHVRRLTPENQTVHTGNARFSPDRKRVLYVTGYGESSQSELWVVVRDGRGGRRISDEDWVVSAATWSPDGRQVLFAAHAPRDSGAGGVYLADEVGSNPRKVFKALMRVQILAWIGARHPD